MEEKEKEKQKQKQNEITFLKGFKIIFICLVAISSISLLIGFLCKLIFKMPLLYGTIIGVLVTIVIIVFTGAWKPATLNENTDDDEDYDD